MMYYILYILLHLFAISLCLSLSIIYKYCIYIYIIYTYFMSLYVVSIFCLCLSMLLDVFYRQINVWIDEVVFLSRMFILPPKPFVLLHCYLRRAPLYSPYTIWSKNWYGGCSPCTSLWVLHIEEANPLGQQLRLAMIFGVKLQWIYMAGQTHRLWQAARESLGTMVLV